jgi:hypothetical protein
VALAQERVEALVSEVEKLILEAQNEQNFVELPVVKLAVL